LCSAAPGIDSAAVVCWCVQRANQQNFEDAWFRGKIFCMGWNKTMNPKSLVLLGRRFQNPWFRVVGLRIIKIVTLIEFLNILFRTFTGE
jgi:hypothetical protein